MKKLLLFFLVTSLLLISAPVMATDAPVIYKSTITVTEDGGRFQVGFATVEFKKDFLDQDLLPVTFEIEIYAENGIPYIEFFPDTPMFYKKVHIKGDAYDGLLFDKATGENIQLNIKRQQILAEHFSRYAWNW